VEEIIAKLELTLGTLVKTGEKLLKERGTIRISQAERHTRAAGREVRLALEQLRQETEGQPDGAQEGQECPA